MSEAEIARDFGAVLEKVRQGSEIVVEQDHRPVAVITPSRPAGRLISEVIADLERRGSTVILDEDFPKDIQEAIEYYRQPWKPPSWD
jgi:antitoxin (DNA-binding transcriptional repressor) of toxin-antitoxin stability system